MKKDIYKTLGIKENAQKVFEILLKSKPVAVSAIAKELHLPKSTIYDAISVLMEESLLVEYNENNIKSYGIAPKEQIINLHQRKIEEIKTSQDEMIKEINNVRRQVIVHPKIKFYSGIDGTRHAFNDMQWVPSCKLSYLMWPMQDMIDAVGEEFLEFHGRKRYEYKIHIKSIRKETDKKIEAEWLKSDLNKHYREVRYAPKNIDWSMSYWIYDDKCLFASGGKERFAFIIYSKEFADLMTKLWDQMWNISKP